MPTGKARAKRKAKGGAKASPPRTVRVLFNRNIARVKVSTFEGQVFRGRILEMTPDDFDALEAAYPPETVIKLKEGRK